MQRRYELSDDEWHLIQDLFPPPKKMGRPRRDDRIFSTGSGYCVQVQLGATCQNAMVLGRQPLTDSANGNRMAPLIAL